MKTTYKSFIKYIFPVVLMFLTLACEDDAVVGDPSALAEKITEAKSLLEGKEEGENPGYYSNRTITKLQNRITWAEGVFSSNQEQKQYDNAVLILQAGMENVINSEVFSKYPKHTINVSSVTAPASPLLAPEDEFTVECRIKLASYHTTVTSKGAGTEQVVANILATEHQYVGANTGGWFIRLYTTPSGTPGDLDFGIGIGATAPWWTSIRVSNALKELNKWYHIAATYSASSLTGKIYIDGVLVGEGTFPSKMVNHHSEGGPKLGIGYAHSWDNELWGYDRRDVDGQIIDVRIWKKALSINEINFRKGDFLDNVSQYSDLNAYWPFNAQKGNSIPDETGQHIATLAGVEWIDPN